LPAATLVPLAAFAQGSQCFLDPQLGGLIQPTLCHSSRSRRRHRATAGRRWQHWQRRRQRRRPALLPQLGKAKGCVGVLSLLLLLLCLLLCVLLWSCLQTAVVGAVSCCERCRCRLLPQLPFLGLDLHTATHEIGRNETGSDNDQ
jgi:hypothetical protein